MIEYVQYWDERHAELGLLRSGGDKGLSDGENYEFYIHRASSVLRNIRAYFVGSRDIRILDVGCGKGLFSEFLMKAGYIVDGVDPSQRAIDQARVTGSANFTQSTIEAFGQTVLYDVVLCIDVLFVILDDKAWEAALSKMLDCVKKDGIIIITDTADQDRYSLGDYIVHRSKSDYIRAFKQANWILDQVEPYAFGSNPNKFLIFRHMDREDIL